MFIHEQVVDYGSKDTFIPSPFDEPPDYLSSKDIPSPAPYNENIDEGPDDVVEPSFHQFYDSSLNNTLEQMRQLKIDCNTALVDVDKQHVVYVSLICKYRCFYDL